MENGWYIIKTTRTADLITFKSEYYYTYDVWSDGKWIYASNFSPNRPIEVIQNCNGMSYIQMVEKTAELNEMSTTKN